MTVPLAIAPSVMCSPVLADAWKAPGLLKAHITEAIVILNERNIDQTLR